MAGGPPLQPPFSGKLAETMAAATAAHRQGRLDEALRLYAKALKLDRNLFQALLLTGVAHLQRGDAKAALDPLAAATRADPRSVDALANYGVALAVTGDPAQALAVLDRALAVAPSHPGALLNRGNALLALDRDQEAVAAFERARAADPRNPEIPNNLGNALSRLGRYDAALASFDAALSLRPDYVQALENRGNTLIVLGRDQDALANYQRALAIRPDYADAHYAESFVRLRLGDFRAGFVKYEWRWRRSELASYRRNLGKPLWLGETPLAGKTILLHAEQGFGDTIHFARYAPLVAQQGATVVLEVQPALKKLLASLAGGAIIGRGDKLPAFDCHCPLLSLPLAFQTELDTIPAEGPYIAPPAERVAHWRSRILEGRAVGIVWCGNPSFRNERNRSMSFADVVPLMRTPGINFVSLNPGLSPDQVAALAELANVAHLAADFRDFADTAAVIQNLDLVVTTDTATAHLAGAMGKPVWIMLSCGPDWRWLMGRDDCPWYPTARLFRQPAPGDWASVIARVRAELMHG